MSGRYFKDSNKFCTRLMANDTRALRIFFVAILVCKSVTGETIWRQVDALHYAVSFYDKKASSYHNAKSICKDGTTLVQLDDIFVRDAVYETIKHAPNVAYFWIGAERNETTACPTGENAVTCKWNWVDGVSVDTNLIEWNDRQPDNYNNKESRMVISKATKKISDIKPTFTIAGTICQKQRDSKAPWKLDTPRYRLTFYDKHALNWSDAEATCARINATLVQLDDEDVRTAVNSSVAGGSINYFWIGAKRTCKSCNTWQWVDNTNANLSSYQWYGNNPDNYGGAEDRLIIRGSDSKFGDITEHFALAGTICQKKRDEYCVEYPNTCQNGGTCTSTQNKVSYYKCNCRPGYYGEICAKTYCQVHPNPCENDGHCTHSSIDPYHNCTCADNGYYGMICEKNYCQFYSNPCKNNGSCYHSSTSPYYNCSCAGNGYYGNACEENYCQFHSNPCKNEGICSNSSTSPFYKCSCADNGYYGKECDENYCQFHTNPCQNQGICLNSSTSPYFNCSCAENGFYGDICDKNYCDSHPNPCENGGACLDSASSPFYRCRCANTGYYGDTCNKTYCEFHEVNPCKHGGMCISKPSVDLHYECKCTATGYSGYNCTMELITVKSKAKTIGIVGAYANIDVEVTTKDGNLTIETRKDAVTDNPQVKTNIGNGITTFIFKINGTEDEGIYTFIAYPTSKEYTRNTSTTLAVHVNATITSFTQSFIFSPITSGSSQVNCTVIGIPTPSVNWYKSNGVVTQNSTSRYGTYQTVNNDTATLHVESAVLGDDGNYTCNTTNKVGEELLSVFDEKILRLAVYGEPTIKKVNTKNCNPTGNLSVEWSPNTQTTEVLHRFSAESVNGSSKNTAFKFVKSDKANIVIFDDLDPWTQYKILVEVCPDKCIAELNDSGMHTTGYGLPGEVTNSRVALNENTNDCIVEWNWPKTPKDQIAEYTVFVEEKYALEPLNVDATSYANNTTKSIEAAKLSYNHSTQPNRNYTFYITARTCAGPSETVTAAGKCVTKSSAPNEIPQAVISTPRKDGPTRKITIPLADETNGPISCTFVIVDRANNTNAGPAYGMSQLHDAANAAISNDNEGEYLAIAVPREKIKEHNFEASVGDNTESQCDISNIFATSNRRRRNAGVNGTILTAKNWPLKTDGTVYGVYLVMITPVEGGKPYVTTSLPGSFMNGTPIPPPGINAGLVAGVTCSAVILIAAVIVAFYIQRRRNRVKKVDEPQVQHNSERGRTLPVVHENVRIDSQTDTDIPFKMLQRQYNLLRANESMQFRVQFQELKAKAVTLPATIATKEQMMIKNRYKNILPYDSTRVSLQGNSADGYINACYITGHDKKFIAAQGPLRNTLVDFWRMIVEQGCKVIVMLTKCEEAGGRKKCEQYWPETGKTTKFHTITVQNLEERHFEGYVRRTLRVSWQSNGELIVNQYQYVKWPDHGVPKTTSAFFRLHETVIENYRATQKDAPLLVHCSAGVGRTGTFIGYDILLGKTKSKSSVDIFSCVLSMRRERVDMVQTCPWKN